jgi:hypothetical protein
MLPFCSKGRIAELENEISSYKKGVATIKEIPAITRGELRVYRC